ncbi:MAG: pyridoxine 5'-phosphate synthase [Gammaproteobacteria bacterium]|jgi:pyridoxine 5-phosphate synthase|nr:MAG: pyridoxine 5'-phosphate synthase [Gammaproteobacteria bacterium]
MTVLSVNVNKIAWLRNAREGGTPDVCWAAETIIGAGAAGITVHPRPDQRHIRPQDVSDLTRFLEDHPGIEFNIEGNPFADPRDNGYPGFDALIEAARPAQATLVPDSDDQLTSDHGWDLSGDNGRLKETIARYQSLGARVSLFMDPDPDQIERAKQVGADRIELYTGPFADAASELGIEAEATRASYTQYLDAARHASQLGLGVNAGHDLDLVNLVLFRGITEVVEVSIGHALISDALKMGLDAAVRAYLAVLAGD